MANNENLKPFKKGADPRRNRLGRPKSFDAVRKLAQQVLAEAIETGDGETVTRITAMLKLMSSSRNPADRKTLLEYAYGKPREEVDVTSGGEKIIFEVIRREVPDSITNPAPEASPVPEQPSQAEGDSSGKARRQNNRRGNAGG